MFETLFSYLAVRRRHREGPFAPERVAYLESLAAKGASKETLLGRARYCLCLARELQNWPRDHCFSHAELEALVASWADVRVDLGRASAPRWPKQNLLSAAADFLGAIGRLVPAPVSPLGRYHEQIDGFVATQRLELFRSAATCQNRRWHIQRFVSFLDRRGSELADTTADEVDAYLEHAAQRWSRVSLRSAAFALRAWFHHGEVRGWVRPGLAEAILVPRIYRHEGLPLGPTWEQVGQMVANTDGDRPLQLRAHALLVVLAVYGFRSGEVQRLRLDDIDWQKERIRVVRSKSSRQDTYPLEPGVGDAIARYLRHGRPKSESRTLFLTVRAPFRPLSAGALYHVVQSHLSRVATLSKGRGPHSLRHACARHLTNAGLSLKEVGDHLGHRSPDATRLYAKVDLRSLRLVALEDLGGLA